ncbi:hypothetical protein L1987_30876 [Smallanthus sonchifolius]|uniref:Uncharacterized protein n=1 Tax=Smallanthus sonchifolius TaxID=185202 RepID=A0ACB9I5G3_9ASTR|nr:hypothetical protein L1987_30876 [Smallanthus sonchifolius]
MLKGKAIENGSTMHLQLEDLEVAKGFTHPLLRGGRCRLELRENWCNDFSGFLMVVTFPYDSCSIEYGIGISIAQVLSGMDLEDDVVWEESDGDSDKYMTWVWYVSFGSLRPTTWWDQTYNAVSFDIKSCLNIDYPSGIGVRLVDKESKSGLTATSTDSSSQYTPKIMLEHDLEASALRISLNPNVS